jgi:hypothetical protein
MNREKSQTFITNLQEVFTDQSLLSILKCIIGKQEKVLIAMLFQLARE